MNSLTPSQLENLCNNQQARIEMAQSSHLLFFYIYFSQFIEFEIPDYQKEIFRLTEDDKTKFGIVISFRGSAKSTIVTESYPLWAILGRMKCKFVVIISQTQDLAKQHFRILKNQMETNQLLRQDLGPFETLEEWKSCSIIIPKYGAKIIAISKDQSIRGVKHNQYRPDLIIGDDLEDSLSVKTPESRRNTRNWFTTEILPLGDLNTKIMLVGNLLHQASLMMTLIEDIKNKNRDGVYRIIPIIDENGVIAWPGKFPDMKTFEKFRLKIGDKFAWAREYLLKIVDEFEPVIKKDSIHRYDKLPPLPKNEDGTFVMGVDLAISKANYSDYTALVSGMIFDIEGRKVLYVLPNPVNSKLDPTETRDTIINLAKGYGRFNTTIYVEEVMLQGYLTALLQEQNFKAEGFRTGTMDKKMKLHFTCLPISTGKALFPETGCEELIEQLTEFGLTAHDDLADAFVIMVMATLEKLNRPPVQRVNLRTKDFYKRIKRV